MKKPHTPHPLRAWRAATALCLGAGLATLAAAQAQTTNESHLSQVTLYPGSATVERTAHIPAGTRQFTFSCLPMQLDIPSLNVMAEAPVQVGEWSVTTQERSASACPASALEQRIRELKDQKASLEADQAALELVKGYLQTVSANGPPAAPVRTATAPQQVAAMADTLHRTAQTSLAQQARIKRQIEQIDPLLTQLLAERERLPANLAQVMSVRVTLATPQEADLRLSYQIHGPGWTPAYRAMLDTSGSTLRLERQALVAQSSGEDWNNVRIQLSTGQPRQGTTGPTPRPWNLSLAEPRAQEDAVLHKGMLAAPAPAPAAAAARMAAAPSFDVSVFEQGFATTFSVPQRINVPANGQPVTLTLDQHHTPARLLTRATPLLDARAWLVAEIAPLEGVWPTGPMQLYRDGAYVGSDMLRSGHSGPLSLAFGRDEQVVVQVDAPKDVRGSAGFVGTRAERRLERGYTLENRHRTPITVQVLEASPVSSHERVEVSAQFEPAPQTRNWNTQPGVVLWEQTLAAGASAHFGAHYTLSWPQDARLQESR